MARLLANCVAGGLLVALAGLFIFRRAAFSTPWDGPAVATIALAAATLALTAVTVFIALLALWGYTTLKEQVENKAQEMAIEAATRVARAEIRNFLSEGADAGGNEIAEAYENEMDG